MKKVNISVDRQAFIYAQDKAIPAEKLFVATDAYKAGYEAAIEDCAKIIGYFFKALLTGELDE